MERTSGLEQSNRPPEHEVYSRDELMAAVKRYIDDWLATMGQKPFGLQERDQSSIMAIGDKDEKRRVRQKRDDAIEYGIFVIEALERHGKVEPDFFKRGISSKVEFVARAIEERAQEGVRQ